MSYMTVMDTDLITGSESAQRMIGRAILDGEDEGVGFILVGDSRVTTLGGAGADMVDALVVGLAGLTTHGNIPQTPVFSTCPYTSGGWCGFMSFSGSGTITGRATTEARAWPNLQPNPATAIADGSGAGTIRCGSHPTDPLRWRFDPYRRNSSPFVRGKGIGGWDLTSNVRARWFACTNTGSATNAYPYFQGITAYSGTVSDTNATTISGIDLPVPELNSSTYAIYDYATVWNPIEDYTQFQLRITASSSGGIECGGARFESSNDVGIWFQHVAQGSTRVESLMTVHPSCGPWLQAFGPYRVGVIACNVNDCFAHTAAEWEPLLRQAIRDLRTLCNQGTLPVIIWIQATPIFAASESSYANSFQSSAGVAKAVANSMPGVVAINTARVISGHYSYAQTNWVPGGMYAGPYNAGTAYSVGDVMQYPGTTPQTDPWYRCMTATTAGQTPVSHASKWHQLEVAYNSGTTYAYGHCVTHGGKQWAYLAQETPAAGQEPGVHANWVECFPYSPHERVHPNPWAAQVMVDEFCKALSVLRGKAAGGGAGNLALSAR